MKELTCIGCPRGCTLKIERDGDGWSVTGNTCPRGREFAISEMTAPKRTICSTVRTAFPDAPVLPVWKGCPGYVSVLWKYVLSYEK